MELIKLILTALLSVGILFVITKLIGHKQVAQLDLFDYITGITLGSIGAEMATELETAWKPLTAMVIYGAVTILLSMVTGKFPRTRKYINGSPTILFNDGKLYRKNMKKAKLELSEFLMLCRQEGYFDLGEIQTAVFECNGRLTVLPKSENRPLTPSDCHLKPAKASIDTEMIMDGRILEENLRRRGLDRTWLSKQLRQQGIGSPRKVFLALCDDQNILTIYQAD